MHAQQPPAWPDNSVARRSDVNSWPAGRLPALAGLIADFAFERRQLGRPIASPAGWVTSGSKNARTAAASEYLSALAEMAIGSATEATGVENALRQLLSFANGLGTDDSHGGYMAYAPTAALVEGALAGFACAAVNPGLTWMPTSPKFAAIEKSVLDWTAADVLRWPANSGGVFTSGGSVANTLGLHVARDTVAKRAGVRPSEVLFFVGDHAHYCFLKGLRVLGVDASQIVRVPCGIDNRIDVSALEKALGGHAKRLSGKAGVIVGVGGETSTGSVDALDDLADLCGRHSNLWMHVDACFGGFFALTNRGADLLHGIERADSVALDPHKALQAPYGIGMLMVRDERDLRNAFSVGASYIPPSSSEPDSQGIVDISDLGLELTREARGAQVWLPLRAHGPEAFAQHLDWCQDAIRWVASVIERQCPQLELVTGPQLSTLTFRVKGDDDIALQKERTARFVDDVNARGRIMLAPTVTVRGVPCIRVCVLSARSTPEHLSALAEDIFAVARR